MQTHFLNYCINLCTGWGNTSWCNKHPINFKVLTTQQSVFCLHSGWVYLISRQPSTRRLRDPASFYLLAPPLVVSKVISFICIQPAQRKDHGGLYLGWFSFPFTFNFPEPSGHTQRQSRLRNAVLLCAEEEEMGLGAESQAVSIERMNFRVS